MNYNQGAYRGYLYSGDAQAGYSQLKKIGTYHIIIVSRNESIHSTLSRMLENFSLNGSSICVLHAGHLEQAKNLIEIHPETVLVLIDDGILVNGSYKVFVDYVHNQLKKSNCTITFKDNLIHSGSEIKRINSTPENLESVEFYNARERLIDITRMILMTSEMESKIDPAGSALNIPRNCENDEESASGSLVIREKFYNTLANELKGPVGNIKLMLDFLTNEPELLDKESSKDLLQRVRESANNVHEMLEDFLFWSRMMRQDVSFNPVKTDLDLVIRENLLLIKTVAASKSIELSYEIPENALVYSDEFLLHTILRNLLYNAVKTTHAGGTIHVKAEPMNELYRVTVSDNGSGMRQEQIDSLLATDLQLTTRGMLMEHGSGMGLVLSRELIEKNGGELHVSSSPNKGSRFSFTIPLWRSH